ncbi:MAG: DUF3667 domain-containing protein [Bacteroidetes bacterium]|nr:DUF3667 domain-containing protein [Bacteroidota bacterium]
MSDQLRICRNCGTALHGPYCSSCGQKDVDIHVPVRELASEFVEVLPSFDRRLFRSIRPLLLDPGHLTMEYVNGKRKHYLSPFKLYLIISFLFFFVGSLTDDTEKRSAAASSLQKQDTPSADSIDVTLRTGNSNVAFTVKDTTQVSELFGTEGMAILRKLKEDPDLMFDKIKEHRSKIIFILLPVFALLLKLLYLRSRVLYVRHLVFSFYFHSFLFLVLFVSDLLELVRLPFEGYVSALLLLTVPANLFRGMRTVYGQPNGKTIVKLLLLSATYAATFLLTMSAAAVIIIILFYR